MSQALPDCSTFHFENAPDNTPQHTLVHIMLKVATLVQVPITQVPFEQQMPKEERAYQIQEGGTGRWNKRVCIWLQSRDEHMELFKRVHGACFAVYEDTVTVEVSNPNLDLDATQCENFIFPVSAPPVVAAPVQRPVDPKPASAATNSFGGMTTSEQEAHALSRGLDIRGMSMPGVGNNTTTQGSLRGGGH